VIAPLVRPARQIGFVDVLFFLFFFALKEKTRRRKGNCLANRGRAPETDKAITE